MSAGAADHFEIEIRVAGHTANDRGYFLAPLCLDALDEVFATLFVQQSIFAVVPGPHPAARRVNQLVGARYNGARREFCDTVATPGEDIRSKAAPPRCSISCQVDASCQIGRKA